MGLRIRTNLLALRAANDLERVGLRYARRLARLGSGLRVERAADDPQALARSERIGARLESTRRAAANVADAISVVRTVEGALGQMSEIGIRLRELAVAASNGTLSTADLELLDAEREALARELFRIAATTDWNEIDLLARHETIPFQVGIDEGDVIGLDLIDFRPVGGVFASYSLLDAVEGRDKVLEYAELLVDTLSGFRGFLGGLENRLASLERSLRLSEEHLARERSLVRDADLAAETSALARERLLLGIGTLVQAQANVSPHVARTLLEAIAELRPGGPPPAHPLGLRPLDERA